MKNLIIILLGVALSFSVRGQDETLIGGKIESGGYGGPVIKIGQLNGETSVFIGGQGGWIINHRFVLGGKGYASVMPAAVDGLDNIVVGFASGGAFFEYILHSNKLLHLSFENMMGYGIVYNDVGNYRDGHDPIDYTGDGCFVLEPGINLNVNVSKLFRVGAGVTYRYVNGANYNPGAPYINRTYETISDSDLGGFSAQIVFKIGMF